MNGQAIKQDIYVLRPSSNISNPIQSQSGNNGCIFELPALAEYEPTDDHFNDIHAPIWFFDDLFSDVKIYLQKKSIEWVDLVELTDNTYGTFYPYGFFVNKFGNSAIGYLIEWTKVLNENGPGSYRIRVSGEKSIGTFDGLTSFEFSLKSYTADRADKTVRVQWNRSGVLGNRLKDSDVDDYGQLNWLNQLRVPNSMFGFDISDFTEEYVRYPNGENEWIGDSQIEELKWDIYLLPNYIHRFIKVDIMQSGKVMFTDYNKLAPTQTIDRICVPTSGYKPEWIVGVITANVSTTWKPYYENLTHKRE